MFRRHKSGEDGQAPTEATADATSGDMGDAPTDGATQQELAVAPAGPVGGTGPRDVSDPAIDPDAPRVDFGALRVPGVDGMEVRVDADEAGNLIAVTVVIDETAIQMSAFAAPRSGAVWDEIRGEISQAIIDAGGSAHDEPGRFGPELVADVVVTLPDGKNATEPMRFVGSEGPRWFVRGLISGRGAHDRAAARSVEDLFAGLIVDRGDHAAPPREPLPLTLPAEASLSPEDDGSASG